MAQYHPARISRISQRKPGDSLTERMLWNELRVLRDDGLNFRRRVPIDGYTVDFFCPRAGLVVQIEGQGDLVYEAALQRFVTNHGFAFCQVKASDVESNPRKVAERVFELCQERGHALFTVVSLA